MIWIYLIGIGIYAYTPLPFQLGIVLLNSFLPDPVPFFDEIIMYALAIGKMSSKLDILDFCLEHPVVIIFLTGIIILGIALLVNIFI